MREWWDIWKKWKTWSHLKVIKDGVNILRIQKIRYRNAQVYQSLDLKVV